MAHNALMHGETDDVAVVIVDISAGTEISALTLDGIARGTVTAIQDIPLGHKVALKDVAEGADLIKYGRAIGTASQNIRVGQHVHTHNVKSKRWA
jgi:(2R)-sulfolactate sulfo-lyase subunit alpha